ncbi:hypothetical protein H4W33_005149 [Kibdelosporangium phytohabitans]|uniref:Uncharacterized protein n=2 Tax=Kibdelosporangium phytohabitans TaxID=860235 RepID=A0A0N9HUY2_9PSEU|nr:hypothetical protein [Kibdelosporangium phytohabitans]ALG05836.1 hypothetical protein AOZ06_01890 [Kibdelosporangium phytohabitans]MBE1466137.1 hypothetical protein [Kibdelosporangium phytohabitans]
MGQMSFFSAEAMQPGVADLAGLLCASGQVAHFARRAARLSVVVGESWRCDAVAEAFAERGIDPEVGVSDEEHPLVRTAFRTDLTSLADAWTRDTSKAVPTGLALDGASLRLWTLATGRWMGNGYVLGLDPMAPETHEPLVGALTRIGLPATLLGPRADGPGIRLTGRRRIGRLVELVGRVPSGAAEPYWPV